MIKELAQAEAGLRTLLKDIDESYKYANDTITIHKLMGKINALIEIADSREAEAKKYSENTASDISDKLGKYLVQSVYKDGYESGYNADRWMPVSPDTMPKEEDSDLNNEILCQDANSNTWIFKWNDEEAFEEFRVVRYMPIPKFTPPVNTKE